MPVIAEISVTPLVEGELKPYVDRVLQEFEKSGLQYEVGAAGTTVQGELDQVMDAIKNAQNAVMDMGAGRVVTDIHLEEARDGLTLEQELEGYRKPALQHT